MNNNERKVCMFVISGSRLMLSKKARSWEMVRSAEGEGDDDEEEEEEED